MAGVCGEAEDSAVDADVGMVTPLLSLTTVPRSCREADAGPLSPSLHFFHVTLPSSLQRVVALPLLLVSLLVLCYWSVHLLFASQLMASSALSASASTSAASIEAFRSVAESYGSSTSSSVLSLSLYAPFAAVCEASGVNVVWNRGDGAHAEAVPLRPWSVSAATFAHSLPACTDSTQLLQAVALGQRKPLDGHHFTRLNLSSFNLTNLTAIDTATVQRYRAAVEWDRSYFEPYQCSPAWRTADDICDVLHSFAYVLFIGDSLLRHISQALFMLLTRDLQYGGLPRMSRQVGLYDTCRCDGQFSENDVCRRYEDWNMFSVRDPRVYGVCSRRINSSFIFGFEERRGGLANMPGYWDSTFCSADTRPRLMLLNGAVHYSYDIDSINSKLLVPLFERLRSATASCAYPITWRILFLSASAQSRVLDHKYPHQTREKSFAFNRRLASYLATMNITMVDVWNMTQNAATSDGFHFLSDVNLQLANAVVNMLHFVSNASASMTS